MRQVIALVGCLSLFLQGCTVMQPVPVPQGGSATAAVQVGDTVEATTRAGEVKRFEVTGVTDAELQGMDARVAYAEIATLKVARSDATKARTVWLILGGAALAALVAGAGGGSGSSY
jgi:hypothetical protein